MRNFQVSSKFTDDFTFDLFYITVGLLSILPLFLYSDYGLEKSVLSRALKNDNVRLIFSGSIALGIPIIVTVMFDILCNLPLRNLISRIVIVLTLIIPGFLYLFDFEKYSSADVYLIVSCSQRVFRVGASYSINREAYPHLFPLKPAYINTVILLLIEFLDLYGLVTHNMVPRIIGVALKYLFYAIIVVILCLPTFQFLKRRWIKSTSTLDFIFKIDNEEEAYSVLVSILTIINVGIHSLLPLAGPGGIFFVEQFNETYLMIYCILTSSISYILTVLPTRVHMFRAFKIEQELDSRKTFVRHISHEVRTPLNAVSVGLDLMQIKLRRVECDQETVDILDDMKESCASAVEILTGIIDYEKIGSDLMALALTAVSVLPFLSRVIHPFIMLASARNVRVIFDQEQYARLETEDWMMDVDEGKLAQVIRNLLSNAVKFSPPGEVVIVRAQVALEEDRPILRVAVIDHGPGISSDDQMKLFKGIVQFHSISHQSGGGSGIGLWVSKKIVDLHGGQLSVESAEGLGCTFFLTIQVRRNVERRVEADELSFPEEIPLQAVEFMRNASLQAYDSTPMPLKILVVDDSLYNRNMMMRLVRSKGYIADEASNGQEAIDYYIAARSEGRSVDAILMDNQMPIMSGKIATSRLRQLGYSGVIVGVTGDALAEDTNDFISVGADVVATKPVNINELNSILRVQIQLKFGF